MNVELVLLAVFLVCVVGFCPEDCNCNDEKLTVYCIKTKLEVIPISLNPSIRVLLVRHNDLKSVGAALHFYTSLHLLDLSHNMIKQVPDKVFKHQKHLKVLNLASNQLETVNEKSFHNLNNLKVLNLKKNSLTTILFQTFQELEALEKLNLADNRLQTLNPGSFRGLGNLQVLDLSGNNLATLTIQNLYPLLSIEWLNLSENGLDTLRGIHSNPKDVFEKNTTYSSQINNFPGFVHLHQLNVSGNLLDSASLELLRVAPNLQVVDLSRNPFRQIKSFQFNPLLKKVYISDCTFLTRIDELAFSTTNQLVVVQISSNPLLSHISPRAFNSLHSLQVLDVSWNSLERLELPPLNSSSLRKLELEGNPWDCSCNNSLHTELLRKFESRALCETPYSKKGKFVRTESGGDCLLEAPRISEGTLLFILVIPLTAAIAVIILAFVYRQSMLTYLKQAYFHSSQEKKGSQNIYWEITEKDDYRTVLSGDVNTSTSLIRNDYYFYTLNKQIRTEQL